MRHLIPAVFIAVLFALPARAEGEIRIADLGWMEGHWVMEGQQGEAEEIWMAPRGGTIVGSFRWVFPNGYLVTEYLLFEETDEGVTFRFKHFNKDFEPWEKDEANTYTVTKVEPNRMEMEITNWNGKVPQHIVYSRAGDTMNFTGTSPDLGDEGEPLILDFRLK